MPVCPQIFISEATGDLNVAVVTCNHHDLLVDLRGLGQGIELAGVHATGDEVIASALRSAASQNWRFDFDELLLVKIIPHGFDDAMPQDQRILHRLTTQIDVTVLESHIFVGQFLDLRGRKGRSFTRVQHLQ